MSTSESGRTRGSWAGPRRRRETGTPAGWTVAVGGRWPRRGMRGPGCPGRVVEHAIVEWSVSTRGKRLAGAAAREGASHSRRPLFFFSSRRRAAARRARRRNRPSSQVHASGRSRLPRRLSRARPMLRATLPSRARSWTGRHPPHHLLRPATVSACFLRGGTPARIPRVPPWSTSTPRRMKPDTPRTHSRSGGQSYRPSRTRRRPPRESAWAPSATRQ